MSFTTEPSPTGINTGGSGCTSCPKPTVTVKATPSSIKSGEKSIISWTSTNVSTCNVSGNEDIDETAGSFNTGPLTKSKSYTITCSGSNGKVSGNAYVFVNTTSGFGLDGNCYDSIKNGNETDIDKGGRCGSGFGLDGNCYDKIKNGDETSVDLGGRCGSGFGLDGNCYDSIKNGNETDIDKGGRCGSGFGLDGNCYDKIKNGDETSVDLGGRCGSFIPYDPNDPNNPYNPNNPNSPYNPNNPNNPYNPNNPNSPYNPNNPNYNPNNPNPYNPNDPNNPYNQGTWGTLPGTGPGTSGTWGTGTDSGTWRATTGTGGTGIVYWAGNGDGTGTWYSTTGNGTWTNGRGTGSAGTGTWTSLVLGQTATPPNDAIVRYHEGIETVFIRQIIKNPIFTQKYGYKAGMNLQIFAGDLADQFARAFGYVNVNGKEIRAGPPDIAAYQLQLVGNKLTVYEYYDNKIVDVRNTTATFKNASGYEYYFKKN